MNHEAGVSSRRRSSPIEQTAEVNEASPIEQSEPVIEAPVENDLVERERVATEQAELSAVRERLGLASIPPAFAANSEALRAVTDGKRFSRKYLRNAPPQAEVVQPAANEANVESTPAQPEEDVVQDEVEPVIPEEEPVPEQPVMEESVAEVQEEELLQPEEAVEVQPEVQESEARAAESTTVVEQLAATEHAEANEQFELADSLDTDPQFLAMRREIEHRRPDKEPPRVRSEAERQFRRTQPELLKAYEKREKTRVYRSLDEDPLYEKYFRSKEYDGRGYKEMDQNHQSHFMWELVRSYPEKADGYASQDEGIRKQVEYLRKLMDDSARESREQNARRQAEIESALKARWERSG